MIIVTLQTSREGMKRVMLYPVRGLDKVSCMINSGTRWSPISLLGISDLPRCPYAKWNDHGRHFIFIYFFAVYILRYFKHPMQSAA